MTFGNLVKDIRYYLGVEEDIELLYLIRSFINTAVLDFVRMNEWLKLIVAETITLDDSDSYKLDSTYLTYNFETEIALINTSTGEYDKYDYQNYLQLSSKTGAYSILGDTLYVTGDATDVELIFTSPGLIAEFPFSLTGASDSVETNVLQYYYDIIKKLVIIQFYDYIKEIEMVRKEEINLQRSLNNLRRKENRSKNYGKIAVVSRA